MGSTKLIKTEPYVIKYRFTLIYILRFTKIPWQGTKIKQENVYYILKVLKMFCSVMANTK